MKRGFAFVAEVEVVGAASGFLPGWRFLLRRSSSAFGDEVDVVAVIAGADHALDVWGSAPVVRSISVRGLGVIAVERAVGGFGVVGQPAGGGEEDDRAVCARGPEDAVAAGAAPGLLSAGFGVELDRSAPSMRAKRGCLRRFGFAAVGPEDATEPSAETRGARSPGPSVQLPPIAPKPVSAAEARFAP